KAIKYDFPMLKDTLDETYGVILYQEQVMQIAQVLAKYTLGGADMLRRAMGKKKPEEMAKQRVIFVEGALKNDVEEETATSIFDLMEKFAGYGFNKSHGTCYALIAYQTAYLKANYPIEFIAALLTSDCHDTDRIAIEIEEAKRLKIKILPPDVNESLEQFTVVDNQTIRFGLSAIKNIGNNLITNIIQERKDNGNYKNLTNFLKRLPNKDLNKKSLESLIKCGALDNFYPRRQMFFNLRQLILFHHEQQQERRNGQHSLFSLMSEPIKQLTLLSIDKQQSLPKNIEAIWEKDLLGLYLSRHPFQDMAIKLKELITPCQQLPQIYIGSPVKIGGVISKIKKIITYSKQIMYFVKIEDLTGSIEIIVFPNLLNQTPDLWQENKLVLVQGRLSNKDDALKIIAGQAEEIIDK
ncbi:MAG: DNA polymerase III subunit alpha, partial [Candidatus Aenigmarchaeota archaeon]|nr:DNA polymerase III subunit alpha [Candidatus Aenigmarchaeota archaeon]